MVPYGKDAQRIRDITQLYYSFVKSYRPDKVNEESTNLTLSEQPAVTVTIPPIQTEPEAIVAPEEIQPESEQTPPPVPDKQKDLVSPHISEASPVLHSPQSTYQNEPQNGILFVDFSQDNDYQFTKPVSFTYRGLEHPVTKWISLYVEICDLLFADYHDQFMTVMNGDVPGYNTLAFADEQHKNKLRTAKPFADACF